MKLTKLNPIASRRFNDNIGTFELFTSQAGIQLQNLLVCFEMFLAAIMHRAVFNYRDYKSSKKTKRKRDGMRDMMPYDILRDARSLTRAARQRAAERTSETTVGSALIKTSGVAVSVLMAPARAFGSVAGSTFGSDKRRKVAVALADGVEELSLEPIEVDSVGENAPPPRRPGGDNSPFDVFT